MPVVSNKNEYNVKYDYGSPEIVIGELKEPLPPALDFSAQTEYDRFQYKFSILNFKKLKVN